MESADPKRFGRSKDVNEAFKGMSIFFGTSLHRVLIDSLFYNLLDNILPQWSKVKQFQTKSSPPPLFAHFSTSSAQAFKVSLPALPTEPVLTVDHKTVMDTEAKKKKRDDANKNIYFKVSQAEQAWGHTIACKNPWQELHELFAEKKNYLKCTAPGDTFHTHVKIEDFMMQDTGAGQSLAIVGISSANFATTVLNVAIMKYWYTRSTLYKFFVNVGGCWAQCFSFYRKSFRMGHHFAKMGGISTILRWKSWTCRVTNELIWIWDE